MRSLGVNNEKGFGNEADLERFVRQVLEKHVPKQCPNVHVLESKKMVDIVLYRDPPEAALFFIEVKFHQKAHGRLGFGGGGGKGFQPEILRKRPLYLEEHLRWVLSRDSRSDRKVLLLVSCRDPVREIPAFPSSLLPR